MWKTTDRYVQQVGKLLDTVVIEIMPVFNVAWIASLSGHTAVLATEPLQLRAPYYGYTVGWVPSDFRTPLCRVLGAVF